MRGPRVLVNSRPAGYPMDMYPITNASLRDLSGVLRLEHACFDDDAWSLLDVVAALAWPGVVRVRAMAGGRLVGFAMGDPIWRQDVSMITTIGVDPDFRRHGIGAALLEECETRLPGERIRLTVREDNDSAIRLYARFGYVHKSRLPNYYRKGRAGLLMEKNRSNAG
jgi:ribosomal protein S18 acetylase RimI-like enzyme